MSFTVVKKDEGFKTKEKCQKAYGKSAVFDEDRGECFHIVGVLRGEAAGMDLADIANKHDVPKYKLENELRKGTIIEKEHTPTRTVSKQIALDHLAEIPDYYTRLEEMEKEAKAEK